MLRGLKLIVLGAASETLWGLSAVLDKFSDRVMRFGWRVSDAAERLEIMAERELETASEDAPAGK